MILPESDDEGDEVASYPRWPVMILSGSAFVAIWGGWVALGLMCGFGPVNLLPGIGSGLTVNLAITLPLGMEVYAAYALGAWLTRRRINSKARTFAKWPSLFSLTLGWGGQVVYHLLASQGIEQAPWQVVVAVSGIPVLVLAFGAGLAHLLTVPHKRTRRPAVAVAVPLEDVAAPVATPVVATVPVVAEVPAPVTATVAPPPLVLVPLLLLAPLFLAPLLVGVFCWARCCRAAAAAAAASWSARQAVWASVSAWVAASRVAWWPVRVVVASWMASTFVRLTGVSRAVVVAVISSVRAWRTSWSTPVPSALENTVVAVSIEVFSCAVASS
ncbi:hypothetical protein ASE15_03175 [Oerskovia sp. Root22]|nr:hypothetical protein ASE15_03175 [Oerskovia sp. Root22]